jgi:hypothetical protein
MTIYNRYVIVENSLASLHVIKKELIKFGIIEDHIWTFGPDGTVSSWPDVVNFFKELETRTGWSYKQHCIVVFFDIALDLGDKTNQSGINSLKGILADYPSLVRIVYSGNFPRIIDSISQELIDQVIQKSRIDQMGDNGPIVRMAIANGIECWAKRYPELPFDTALAGKFNLKYSNCADSFISYFGDSLLSLLAARLRSSENHSNIASFQIVKMFRRRALIVSFDDPIENDPVTTRKIFTTINSDKKSLDAEIRSFVQASRSQNWQPYSLVPGEGVQKFTLPSTETHFFEQTYFGLVSLREQFGIGKVSDTQLIAIKEMLQATQTSPKVPPESCKEQNIARYRADKEKLRFAKHTCSSLGKFSHYLAYDVGLYKFLTNPALFSIEVIEAFIDKFLSGSYESYYNSSDLSFQNGDLGPDTVLINADGSNNEVRVIDFSSGGNLPPLYDLDRFRLQLLCATDDDNVKKSNLPSRLLILDAEWSQKKLSYKSRRSPIDSEIRIQNFKAIQEKILEVRSSTLNNVVFAGRAKIERTAAFFQVVNALDLTLRSDFGIYGKLWLVSFATRQLLELQKTNV